MRRSSRTRVSSPYALFLAKLRFTPMRRIAVDAILPYTLHGYNMFGKYYAIEHYYSPFLPIGSEQYNHL
jgi:hypothetical protein